MSTKQPLEFHKFEVALENAQQAFWAAVVEQYPEISSGDFHPLESNAFDICCRKALNHWLDYNYPTIYKLETPTFLHELAKDIAKEFPDLVDTNSKQAEWIALIKLHQQRLENQREESR